MGRYSVSARNIETVEVEASNWLVALGFGLEKLSGIASIERLACEVLQNGTVIVRDPVTGAGYVVQAEVSEVRGEEPQPIEDEDLLVGEEAPEPDDDDGLTAITDAEDAEDACQAALHASQEIVFAESGSILLEKDGCLSFFVVTGPHADTLRGVELPLGSGVAGYAMQKRRAVVLGNATEDPRHFPGVDMMTGSNTREMACIPIQHGDAVFGVIEVLNLPQGRRFAREDLHRLQVIANILGGYLATAS